MLIINIVFTDIENINFKHEVLSEVNISIS